jgi:hypothetical protein
MRFQSTISAWPAPAMLKCSSAPPGDGRPIVTENFADYARLVATALTGEDNGVREERPRQIALKLAAAYVVSLKWRVPDG